MLFAEGGKATWEKYLEANGGPDPIGREILENTERFANLAEELIKSGNPVKGAIDDAIDDVVRGKNNTREAPMSMYGTGYLTMVLAETWPHGETLRDTMVDLEPGMPLYRTAEEYKQGLDIVPAQ